MLRTLYYDCVPGKRPEVIELLADSHASSHVGGREAVIWAADPDDEDRLVVCEYWTNLEEFAAGTHSEIVSYFKDETKGLIADWKFGIEAIPVRAFGLPAPALDHQD